MELCKTSISLVLISYIDEFYRIGYQKHQNWVFWYILCALNFKYITSGEQNLLGFLEDCNKLLGKASKYVATFHETTHSEEEEKNSI